MSDETDQEYDPVADAWESVLEGYKAIRERMAAGGRGWEPKSPDQGMSLDKPHYQ